ncbi:hypothetical protein [Desulfotalea psychrophila]|uniref:Uncharacterized protein n=1 Tax=Desulfotalea psychrophila (strain LSv54 / DSM 12343) TaxID=177439 RepID=Q6ANK3_DESPS|nr:hypothetical protein [Desulfotalea psychrophila]CAG36071.1 unknown protein [Desulfotalea psychrophila LSv54]
MCALKTLYFPGTAIYSARQYPMFLLPATIYLLQPIEDSTISHDTDLNDSFIKNDFCQAYTPCPLGDNRARFLHLVRDIGTRKDDYAAQLSSLSLAALSAKNKAHPESRGDIISSLLGGHDLTSQEGTEIWQARLVLKLAELLEREEEELSRNLSLLEGYELELLQNLHGEFIDEEENPLADLQLLEKNMVSQGSGAVQNRLLAWKTLYQRSEERFKTIDIFITDNRDAAERMLDSYNTLTESLIKPSFAIALPAITGWESLESIERITAFKEENSSLLEGIEALVQGQNYEDIALWNAAIEVAFPREKYGRKRIDIYSFEDASCGSLLEKRKETGAQGHLLLFCEED